MILVYKDGYPESDFMVETFYKLNKDKDLVLTSSSLVVYRFRVAVREGDIPPFDIEVYDSGELYLLSVDRDGRVVGDYPDILNLDSDLLDRLLF